MLRQLFHRYRQSLLLTLALGLPLASIYHHGKLRQETSVVERFLLLVTSPVTRASATAIEEVRRVIRGYVMLTEVEARNEELERENQILLGEALKSRAQAAELERVKQLCEFRARRKDLVTVPARVLSRDVSQFFQVVRVRLDVEGAQDVREGQAVITHDGVVGRIERMAGPWADVMLITDNRSQLHASIPGKGVVGSVRGKGKRNEFEVQFVYLDSVDRTLPVQSGDAVVTTGHDRVFPPGLEIGHVADAHGKRNGPYHEFLLAPAVSYARLEEVLIVTGYESAGELAEAPATGVRPPTRAVDPANTPDAPH